MKAHQFSRTAQVMALFRALETARPEPVRLLSDVFSIEVLPASYRTLVLASRNRWLGAAVCALIDRRWPGARTSAVARTRLIDDWVTSVVTDGTRQVVILGAGFDSRAWRLPALAEIPVFEVDHPATSREKRRLLAKAGLAPDRIIQVAIDFDRDSLAEALAEHGLDKTRRTFVIWEGVTNYLTAEAVGSVLRWMSGFVHGSALAFTYVHAQVLKDPASFDGGERIVALVAKAGEPWTFGIDPAELSNYLQATALALVEDMGADDYRARYRIPENSRWRGYAFYRAALATVP